MGQLHRLFREVWRLCGLWGGIGLLWCMTASSEGIKKLYQSVLGSLETSSVIWGLLSSKLARWDLHHRWSGINNHQHVCMFTNLYNLLYTAIELCIHMFADLLIECTTDLTHVLKGSCKQTWYYQRRLHERTLHSPRWCSSLHKSGKNSLYQDIYLFPVACMCHQTLLWCRISS